MANNKLTNMNPYWVQLSDNFLDSDELGWGAVLYTGMPLWFNRFFDRYQKRSVEGLVRDISFKNKKILDVGCGVGRWCLFFKQRGGRVTGVDLEEKRLKKAHNTPQLAGIDFRQMFLEKLDFSDESFDLVNSVTVLQHIPEEPKKQAIKEVCRVTKKGGYLSIVELIDLFDDASHVFPWSQEQWVRAFEQNGCRLIKKNGCEYSFILRFLRLLQYRITGRKTIKRKGNQVRIGTLERAILRVVIWLSYPLEEVCSRIMPARWARHNGFLFQKTI